MDRIRIGNSLNIYYPLALEINGSPVSLSSASLTVVITDPYGEEHTVSHTVSGSAIVFSFNGNDQSAKGRYRVTIWANYGSSDQGAIDSVDLFELIGSSSYEKIGTVSPIVITKKIKLS